VAEYRIDDLAREAGTTTRNVRVYQENGLLPRPQRRGRVAIYTDKHLNQLQAIVRLLSEGFTVKHILKFITGLQRGEGLVEVLDLSGLGDLVTSPWSKPQVQTMTLAQLEVKLGALDAMSLRRMTTNGVIKQTDEPETYLVPDSRVIDDFAELTSRGMPLAVILKATAGVDKKLDDAARIMTQAGNNEIVRQRGTGWYPSDDVELAWAADLIDVMRRVSRRSAHASLDRALDAAVRDELQQYHRQAKESGAPGERKV